VAVRAADPAVELQFKAVELELTLVPVAVVAAVELEPDLAAVAVRADTLKQFKIVQLLHMFTQ
jgi:hypothetical protein